MLQSNDGTNLATECGSMSNPMNELSALILEKCKEGKISHMLYLDKTVAEGIAKWCDVEEADVREKARELGVIVYAF